MKIKESFKNLIKVIKDNTHNHDNKSTLDKLTETKLYSYDNHLSNTGIHKNEEDSKKLNEISLVDGGG